MEHQIKLIYVYSITGSRAYFLKNITKQWSWEKIASHNKSKAGRALGHKSNSKCNYAMKA